MMDNQKNMCMMVIVILCSFMSLSAVGMMLNFILAPIEVWIKCILVVVLILHLAYLVTALIANFGSRQIWEKTLPLVRIFSNIMFSIAALALLGGICLVIYVIKNVPDFMTLLIMIAMCIWVIFMAGMYAGIIWSLTKLYDGSKQLRYVPVVYSLIPSELNYA